MTDFLLPPNNSYSSSYCSPYSYMDHDQIGSQPSPNTPSPQTTSPEAQRQFQSPQALRQLSMYAPIQDYPQSTFSYLSPSNRSMYPGNDKDLFFDNIPFHGQQLEELLPIVAADYPMLGSNWPTESPSDPLLIPTTFSCLPTISDVSTSSSPHLAGAFLGTVPPTISRQNLQTCVPEQNVVQKHHQSLLTAAQNSRCLQEFSPVLSSPNEPVSPVSLEVWRSLSVTPDHKRRSHSRSPLDNRLLVSKSSPTSRKTPRRDKVERSSESEFNFASQRTISWEETSCVPMDTDAQCSSRGVPQSTERRVTNIRRGSYDDSHRAAERQKYNVPSGESLKKECDSSRWYARNFKPLNHENMH